MGDKPDKEKSAVTFTAKELFDTYHAQGRKNRRDFSKLLVVLPEEVTDLYNLWQKKVRYATFKRSSTRKRVRVVLYRREVLSEATPYDITQAVALITHPANGWCVTAKTTKVKGKFWTTVVLKIY